MKPLLKIGGITDLHDARYCAAVGISFLGFNLGKEDGKHLTRLMVKEMLTWISGPEGVGEFSYNPPDEITNIVSGSGLTWISVPADYLREDAAQLPLPLIFRVNTENDLLYLESLSALFPSSLFEIHPGMFFSLTSTLQKILCPKSMILAETSEPVWAFHQKSGLVPYGFSLGDFLISESGQVNYSVCDEFLSEYEDQVLK